MNIKITTLVENCVKGRGVMAEHGLSMLFETHNSRILFDTGASSLFLDNAKVLGKDIENIDYLVLSHGHSDHTGGLNAFLATNTKAKVICKSSILIPKYRGARENGISNISNLDLSRFIFIDKLTKLTKGVYVMPNIDITNNNDTHFSNFELMTQEGRVPDKFEDELAIVIEKQNEISIFSACSHRGITNIISSARRYFPSSKFRYLIGGFHLVDSPINDTIFISDFLKEDMPEHIGICHCTGFESFSVLKNELREKVFYNHCGYELII